MPLPLVTSLTVMDFRPHPTSISYTETDQSPNHTDHLNHTTDDQTDTVQSDWLSSYHFKLFNARSLNNKFLHLQSLIYSSPPGIFAITETWLTNQILDAEVLPHEYSVYRKDRCSRGGGVL